MFKNVEARFALRVGVVALLGGLSAAGAIFVDNVYIQILSAMVSAGAGYAGLGALVPQVEPNIGNKLEGE